MNLPFGNAGHIGRASITHALALALVFACSVTSTHAEDIVVRPLPDAGKGVMIDFNGMVLEEALKRTQKRYGPYRYTTRPTTLIRDRMLEELVRGEDVNVTVVATQPSWEEKLLPIRIPVDMGLSGYRISLIDRDAQETLSAVRSLADLQALRLGAGSSWSSRKVFDADGFRVVTGDSYEALLKMLLADRFDYFPRGLNEAFPEFDARHVDYPNLAIEKDLLIEFPLPTYVFVSPNAPRLAKRLEEGMESMVRDGTLLRMMLQFNADVLTRANLCARRVFHITNPALSDKTQLARKELWFDPFDAKTGSCTQPARVRKVKGRS